MSSCSVVWWEKWIGQASCDDSCSVLCRCEGTGTQGSRAFSLRHFLTHSGKAGLGCPWLIFCDSHDFFLVAKIHADPLKPLWRVGGIL